MSSDKRISLCQTNHFTTLLQRISDIMKQGQLFDVTLTSNGPNIRCHRLILSAFSPYFAQIISNEPSPDLLIYVSDIEFRDLEALVYFMYHGEVTVSSERAVAFARAAVKLQIIGLTGKIEDNKSDSLLRREVGRSGQGTGSPLQKQQGKFQNVHQQRAAQNTAKQGQGKRKTDVDPSEEILKNQLERPGSSTQSQKRARATSAIANGSPLTVVKIPPAATITRQSGSDSTTAAHFSGGSSGFSAKTPDKGLDSSVKNPVHAAPLQSNKRKVPPLLPLDLTAPLSAPAPISFAERLEKAALHVGRGNIDVAEACSKYGLSLDELDDYVKYRLAERQMSFSKGKQMNSGDQPGTQND